MKRLFLILLLVGMSQSLSAQVSVSAANMTYTIDFESTFAGVNNGAFTGSGFQPVPAAGQLDSDAWSLTGMGDGTVNFGDTETSGDFARGSSAGGESTGGIYAFEVSAGNEALGFQAGGSDWTPGTLVLAIQNTSGGTITGFDIAYDIWVKNDQARANDFNFSHSTDNSSYTSVGALDFTSPEAADAGAWTMTPRSTTISGLTLADGATFYIRWSGDDNTGGGSRDEFAIDNIDITAAAAAPNPEPTEQPSNFTASLSACDAISISFTDAGGAQLPNGYLIIGSTAAISAPVDGTDPTLDADLSDGSAIIKVAHGAGGTADFTGLNSSTVYNFQVWSYTNAGTDIDFLTSPAGPTASETTLLPLSAEGFSTCPPNNQAENFDNSAGAAAATTWECANGYLEANVFGNGNGTGAESWYILNGFNLDQSTNEVFSFSSYTRFNDGIPGLTVKYSTNYSGSGDPDNAAWTDLSPNLPAANSSVWTLSGLMDISSLSGTVYIAFVYESTANGAGTSTSWRIDDIEICGVSTCVTPTNAMNVSALDEGNAEAEVSWTNPSCFDEVIVVAHTSSIGGVPAGSYTANSNDFTDGANPAFPGGGVVVYNGATSPQTITGLTNGQTYYFKIFSTRLGAWSSGVEVSATPILPPDGLQVNQNQKFYGSGFDETTLGINRGQFDGSGISNPSPGQLSSLGWRFEGFSDGDSNYGDVITSGDYARGTSTGGVTSGGMYAFQRTVAGSVNHFMGFQPTGSDFTEGSAILRVQNQTGGDLRNIEVNFLILEYNDQARSQEIKFYYSTDDATWTEVSSVAHYTGLSADPSPTWEGFQKKAVIYDLNVANGDYIYFRWGSDDFDGSGSRDEIGFDNIVFKANFWSGTGTPNCDGCGGNP